MAVEEEQIKRDEQCPLLQMDGEAGVPQSPPNTVSPGWKVACIPKRPRFDRWPEYISACWMSLILLAITFFVFYAVGMSAYRRKPVVVVKCNTSKPENNVFFHHIIPRGNNLHLTLYSDYLSNMAVEYPLLHIHVFFLLDDSLHNSAYGAKNLPVIKRFGSYIINNAYPVPVNEKDKQEIQELQQRYRNINITVMSLNQYMAMTPLRYKWRMIPIFYLSFYARVFAVWEYGGIGLDLTTFNNQHHIQQNVDRKIAAILKQHNDGIEENRYIQALDTIDREEEYEIFKIIQNFITNIFDNTFTFFDNTLPSPPMTTEKNNYVFTLSRNYRNRQENDNFFLNDINLNKRLSYNPLNNTNVPKFSGSYLYYNFHPISRKETDSKESVAAINISKNSTSINKNNNTINSQSNASVKVLNIRESNINDSFMNTNNISKQDNKSFIDLKSKEISDKSVGARKILNVEKNTSKPFPLIFDNLKKVWELQLHQTPLNDEHEKISTEATKVKKNDYGLGTNKLHIIKASTDISPLVMLYDFSSFSDGVGFGPSYFLPDIQFPKLSIGTNSLWDSIKTKIKTINRTPCLLSITSNGNFVAATSRHHPFLSQILSSGCKRVNPRLAIEDAMLSQCSEFLRNDMYCDNIYILD